MKLIEKEITYKQLFDILGYNEEIKDYALIKPKFDIYVETPNKEKVKIEKIIRKEEQPVCEIKTENNKTFGCSYEHLFQNSKGRSVKAYNAKEIMTIDGLEKIISFEDKGIEKVYDVSIPAPHWYISSNGIIHHNTYYALSICESFLSKHENGVVIYVDTENAVDKETFESRGLDSKRIMYLPMDTVENYKKEVIKLINYINENKDITNALLVTDSISKLTSKDEIENASVGKDNNMEGARIAKLLKSAYRTFGLKLAKKGITHLVTAHVMVDIGSFYGGNKVSGGSGGKYEGSYIISLSKAQNKEGTEVTGGIITSKLIKGRYTKEKTKVKTLLSYSKGLHPYYGLPEFCVENGIWEKVGTKIKVGDKTFFAKHILKNSKTFFTEDLMKQINEKCKEVFCFNNGDFFNDEDNEDIVPTEEDEVIEEDKE